LLISGEGVSLGYLNKKNITDKKFVLPSNEKKRVYKTGDKVQYNSHGELIYNGRIDNQVKIRGFRIELEEVENVLERHKMINEAYVTYTKDKLIAFLRVNNNFNREDVYIYLNKKLPKYTIPSQIKKVSEFPLTNNGKIDKKRLLDLI
ncbi:acyl-coenzyme A synthetase/AMP-(fatty) acid ligase, partial [Staphylococcus epidermidis]